MTSRTQEMYRQKLATADQAAALVKSGNAVFIGEFVQGVEAVEAALQLRGQAEANQIKDAKFGLIQSLGGGWQAGQ